MFDLRYHVASLTAVFVALVIGILVGIGLSGKGFVNDAERANLTGRIADLQHERDVAKASLDAANRGARALDDFADAAYPSVVPGRLDGKKVAVLFVGPVDQGVSFAVGKGVRDAGGTVVRTRSISVPFDIAAVQEGLRGDPAFRRYLGRITSAISATHSRRSSPPAGRHRSGMRSARSSSRNGRARRHRLRMPSSSSGLPSRSKG